MSAKTTIATWFVSDDAGSATYFPQVGRRSDTSEFQAVYWRCTAVFFASSLAVNPEARHVFFTNAPVPTIDGHDLARLFAEWGVEVVTLPIGWRLPRGAVGSWGNQFYVFDAIRHFADHSDTDRLVLLDSDCLWPRSVEAMEAAIDRHHALTYHLGYDEHALTEQINGLSRAGMARFAAGHGAPTQSEIPYFGGEIYAATKAASARFIAQADRLWPEVSAAAPDAPREEAHLLSVIYALEDIAAGTANPFIRRMWTTFHHHNLRPTDANLTLWHLPAEKRTGFADLFRTMLRQPGLHPARDGEAMGLTRANYGRVMGFPRRTPAKFMRDLSLKVAEKLRG